jgi:Tol biopolymer transport system component
MMAYMKPHSSRATATTATFGCLRCINAQNFLLARQITNDSANNDIPAWLPDGSQIAFTSDRSWNNDIWVVPATGGPARQITTDPDDAGYPTWSPDGSQIAFASYPNENYDIWVISSAGGMATRVTNDSAQYYIPAWSPDGSQIAFTSGFGIGDIWVIPAGGGTPTQVTADPNYDVWPAWSPDGTKIAFASDRSGNFDIWVIPVPATAVQTQSWTSIKEKYRE